jgi:hypothetical protein
MRLGDPYCTVVGLKVFVLLDVNCPWRHAENLSTKGHGAGANHANKNCPSMHPLCCL